MVKLCKIVNNDTEKAEKGIDLYWMKLINYCKWKANNTRDV